MPPHGPRLRPWKLLPIVERELRIAARGRAFYRWRTLVVATGLGLMAVVALGLTADRTPLNVQGQSLFHTLLVISAVYAFLASVSVTADSVSREKRDGTLGLLFLTDLRGRDIIFGKLAANSLNTVYALLGMLPLLAIPIMMGGVSIEAGIRAALGVVNLMFVCLGVGILVSTLSWDERRATFAAMVTGLVVLWGPFVMGGLWVVLLGSGPLFTILLSALSPLYPITSVIPNFTGVRAWPPLLDLLPSHLLGWCFLLWAGRLAERAWHRRGDAPVKRTVDERMFTPSNPELRARHRRSMMEIHPLVWLLERHAGKRFYADGLVAAILAIWIWGYRTYGMDMLGGPSWFLIVPLAFLVHLIFASWVVAESSMRLLEDRRSGALELLLCTSLTDRDLIAGHRLALRRLFLRPILLLAAAEVFVAFTGFGPENDAASRNGRWMLLAMAAAVALDMHALPWISLRLAVTLPTVNRVGAFALAVTPLGPVLLTALLAPPIAAAMRPGNGATFPLVIAVWVSCVAFVDLVVGEWIFRRAVMREFREAAARIQPRVMVSG